MTLSNLDQTHIHRAAIHVLQAPLDMPEVLRRFVEGAIQLTTAEQGAMALLPLGFENPLTQEVTLHFLLDMLPHYAYDRTTRLLSALTLEAIDQGHPLRIDNTQIETRFHNQVWQQKYCKRMVPDTPLSPTPAWTTPQALLVMPLQTTETDVGALIVYRDQAHPFEADEQFRLKLYVDLAMPALLKAQKYPITYEEMRLFLSNFRHEAFTPITNIIGYSRMLQQHNGGTLTERQQKHINIIHEQVHYLHGVFIKMRTLFEIVSNTITFQLKVVDLSQCLMAVAAQWYETVMTKNQTMRFDLPQGLIVNIDVYKVQSVLVALLENAFKYTPIGGRIELTIQTNKDRAQVIVQDNGVGIEEELQPKLFQEYFMRGENPIVYEQRGWGVSLFNAMYIIRRLGGDMGIESLEGEGSTFWFTLPLSQDS